MSFFTELRGGISQSTIYGTPRADEVRISRASGLDGALGYYDVSINGVHRLMTKEQLESSTFELGAGDDYLWVDADVDVGITAHGGSGRDKLVGGMGNDRFDGGSDDDGLFGRGGDDRLKGGSGNDYLLGGKGVDWNDPGPGRHDVVRLTLPTTVASCRSYQQRK